MIEKTKGNSNKVPVKSFTQATATAKNILKIKKVFPTLPNRKIIKIHNAAMEKLVNRNKKIQTTTKDPSRKQAIVPIIEKHVDLIMNKVL